MKIAFIYMASGFGSRFGGNKLLEKFGGKPLYRHGMEALLRAAKLVEQRKGWQVQVIVVSQYEEILRAAKEAGAQTVYNQESSRGITASLVYGTEAAGDADVFLYCVADQPQLTPETAADFTVSFGESEKGMGCLAFGERRGNPAAFKSRYRSQLLELKGDKGGRQLMDRYPQDLWLYQAEEEELWDVDRREDLREDETDREDMNNGSRAEK